MKQLTKQQQKDEEGEAYDAIVKRAQEAYDAIVDPAWNAYHDIVNPAWKAYLAIVDPAYKAYRDKIAEINARPDEVEQIITKNGRQYKLIKEEE
jgi:hypothetical protein